MFVLVAPSQDEYGKLWSDFVLVSENASPPHALACRTLKAQLKRSSKKFKNMLILTMF